MIKKTAILLLILSVLSQYTFGAFAIAAEAQIVVDGKTATELEQKGEITDIKTSTISGESAFNSFTRFNVNRDNIVNLYLPGNTSNLLNMVHSETSHINGILNSIKDNQIGGNVYFLNPHGIMVGAEGVVNVGSLTVVTPTTNFMDSVFTSSGNISALAVNTITEGRVPLSESGLITVAGKINAINDINLAAENVTVAAHEVKQGIVNTGANYSVQNGNNTDRVNFSDVVNINGLESGEWVAVENGDIKIKAAGDFVNEGIIATEGADNLNAGAIDIRAGNDIYLKEDSLISARGRGENSDGGEIIIFADRNSEFNQGAVIDTRGGDSGDGGFIEFSAEDKVLISGGIFKVSAEEGQSGSVFIDPDDIEFVNHNHYLHGGDYYLIADKSITIGDGVIISTQDLNWSNYSARNTGDPDLTNSEYSKGDSGNIELTAPQITLNSGSKLLAQAINKERIEDENGNITQEATDFQSGNITITAELSSDTPDFFNEELEINSVNAATSIELNDAILKGNNITLEAKTTAENIWDYTNYFDKEDPGQDLLQASATTFGLGTGFNVAYVKSMGSSEILLQGNTDIEASGMVDLAATSNSTASLQTIAGGNKIAGIAFAYGDLESSANVNIGSGTQISADELNLTALNEATLDVNAMGITETADYEAGIAVTNADVSSTAKIADGAKISTGNLVISAVNNNSFSTKASSMALEDGKAGVGAAIFTANTGAEASYAGDFVENEYGNLQNLTIEALDNNKKNITTSAATTGSNFLMKPIVSRANEGVNFVRNKIASNPGFDKSSGAAEPDGGTKKWKLAGAVSYADTDQSAEAFIGDDTEINAGGDIAISARVRDDEVQNRAVSTVVSEAPGEGSTADVSLSAAIAYGNYSHSAKAYTGDNSKITANHLGLQSDVLKPYAKDWSIGSTAEEVGNQIVGVGEDLFSVGGDVLGLTTNGYITGYANAMGSAENANIAGAISYLDFANNSLAYTGQGSEIYLQEDNDWTTVLSGAAGIEDLPDDFSTLAWNTPLHITAHSETGGVYTAGNIFAIIPGTTGGKGSVGAGYNQVNYINNTKAFISEGTVVEGQEIEQEDTESGEGTGEGGNEEESEPVFYNPDITVTAYSRENIISVSPTAGKGSSWGLNGTFSLNRINNETQASIDDEAKLDVGKINLLQARDEINNWALSGAFNLSNNVGVGTGIAINNVNTDTKAFIGNNDNNHEDGSQLSVSDGQITVEQIDITARTEGKIKSIAVAGAGVRSLNPYTSSSGIMTKIKDKLPKFGKKTSDSLSAKPAPLARPKFGLGVSGSVAYNITDLDTSAFVTDSFLDFSGENAGGLNLSSINNADITAGSGTGALVMANSPASNFSVGIAGSVAINDLTNTTSTYGDNVNIVGADNIDLKSLSGGEALAVAIGASINTSADQDKAANIAGSVSVNMTENDVKAYLASSDMQGNSSEEEANESNLNLTAYDRSRLGTGSGSLLGGGKAGIGTAISYSSINNDIKSYLAGTEVSDFNSLQVHALNNSRIASGGGMAALAGGNSNTLAGSFVINETSNITSAEIREGSVVTVNDKIDLQARDTDGIDTLDNIIQSQIDYTILDYDGDAIYGEVYEVKNGDTLSSIAAEYNTTEERLRELNNIKPTDNIVTGQELVTPVSAGGSSILGIAGLVQVSGNNAGISMIWNNVSNDFTASVHNSGLETMADDGQINIKALSSTDITGMALGAGISLNQFAGAGSVVVNEIKGNNTRAEVYSDSEHIIKSDHLNVEAKDNSSVDSLAGQVTASIGNAAVGAAVISNQISNNSVEANITGVDLGVEKNTLIRALRSGKIRGLAASASGSAGVALNGSIMHSSITNTTRADLIDIKSESETNLVTVEAEDNTDLQTLSGSAAVAGGGAVSGAVTINNIDSSTEANVRGGNAAAPIQLGGLQVKAAADQTINAYAYQGSGGLYLAAGAAIADNNVNYGLQTGIEKGSNLHIENDGTLKLETVDNINLDSEARGYTLGAVAAGAVAANSERTGNTTATIGSEGSTGDETNIELDGGKLIIDSQRLGAIKSFTQAGAGGVLNLLDTSHATADDTGALKAGLNNNVNITGTTTFYGYGEGTDIDITAVAKPQVRARAEGYNGSLTASAGMAKAKAEAELDIEASIGTGGSVTAEGLKIEALNQLNNGNDTAYSYAQAVDGGVLLGANATRSQALSSLTVKSYTASDLNINKKAEILADNVNSQQAFVTGVVGGAAAVGGNWANASSDSLTVTAAGNIEIDNNFAHAVDKTINVSGEDLNLNIGENNHNSLLKINAAGTDHNYSDATSGSGGIVAGAAADARTDSVSNVHAAVAGGTVIHTDDLEIKAEHNTDYNSRANSINAAVLGYSGSNAENNVNSVVNTEIGDNTELYTTDADIQATNTVRQSGADENVKGGAGGVINGSAVKSKSTVKETTKVNIGRNIVLKVMGNPGYNAGSLNLGVNNNLDVFDETTLRTGGAIQNPYANTTHTDDISGTLNIGQGTKLFSAGDLRARAYTDARVFTSSLVKTYGGVAKAGGNAITDISAEQKVKTGNNSYLMSYGDLELAAGKSGDGWWLNNVSSRARTEVYNYTAAPLDTSPYAEANTSSNNLLEIGEGTVLESGRNITLATHEGTVAATGSGTGHNPYLEAFGTTKEDGHTDIKKSNWILMNGEATAGIFHDQELNIDRWGNITTGENSRDISWYKGTSNPQEEIQDQIDYLEYRKDNASTEEEKGSIQAEIDILEMLRSSVAGHDVDTVNVSDIYAAGGNITVDTDNLVGSAKLTAYGGPEISINNDSNYYLSLGQLYIPDTDTGGAVRFSGSVDHSLVDLSISEIDKGEQSQILISNNYDAGSGDGPAIFLNQPVENQRGLVKIYNKTGSLAQFSDVRALQYQVDVPNGSFIVNNPNGFYYATAEPSTAWSHRGYRPISANAAVALAAKYYFQHDYWREDTFSGGNFNSFLRDPENKMDGDPVSGGKTYVLRNLPNIYPGVIDGKDPEGNMGLFDGNFKMWKVADWNQQINAPYEDGNHINSAPIKAEKIGVNAKYIDINGTIRAGIPGDWSIDISSDLDDWIESQSGNGSIDVPENYYQINESGDLLPTLSYNAGEDRLVLDDIKASGGGFVYLHGNIISTNKMGNIELLNGFGDVQINNESSKPVEIGDINTGQQTVGEIKIADTARNTVTWYVNKLGEGTRVYSAPIYSSGDYNQANDVTNIADKNTYTPLQGQRYQWENTCTLERSFGGVNDLEEGDAPSFYRIKQPSSWRNTSGWSTSYTVTKNNNNEALPYFREEISYGDLRDWYVFSVDAADGGKGWPTGSSRDWYYYIPREAELTITSSVKADNPIGISFEGNDTARVDIDSAAGISLTGSIENIYGNTNLKTLGQNRGIEQTADAIINSGNISLYTDTNIGSAGNPVRVSLNNDGSITAISNKGNIYLDVPSGPAVINKLQAGNSTGGYGDIYLSADGNINTQNNPLTASNINLSSVSGAVGSADNPLQMNTYSQKHDEGHVFGGRVSADAVNDIYITEVDGDLRLLKVHSGQGDVSITVPNGNIINAVEERSIDKERRDELEAIWDKLSMTAEYNGQGDAEENTVKPYENMVNRTYREYWYLLENGQVVDGEFILGSEAVDYYRDRAAAVMGLDAPTEQQVQEYTGGLFNEYRSYFSKIYEPEDNTEWENLSQFQEYNPEYTYTAPADKVEELTNGAEWLPSRLIYQISQNALKPDTGGQLVTQEANIKADNVYLSTAEGTPGGIGSLDEPVEIVLPAEGETISLDPDEKAALVRASMPGDITINYNSENKAERITILQTNPVYLSSTGGLNLKASDEIFINSAENLNLVSLMAGGDIRLINDGDIINQSEGIAITGSGNLALQTAGSIGNTEKLLSYSVDGILATVSAGKDIYLTTDGDMKLGRMNAVEKIRLEVPSGGLYGQYSGLSLLAENLELEIRDNVSGRGYVDGDQDSLFVEVKPEGKLTADIGGKAVLASPGKVLNLGRVNAGEKLWILAGTLQGEERITTPVLTTETSEGQIFSGDNDIGSFTALNTYTGDIVLNNANNLLTVLGINQNIGEINLSNTGNITITGLTKTEEGQVKLKSGADTEIAGPITAGSGSDIMINTGGNTWIKESISTTGKVEIDAGGTIVETEEGKILNASILNTESTGGQLLNGNNKVKKYISINDDSGNIELSNTSEQLIIENINQSAEADVRISNDGSIGIGKIILNNGNVNISAKESITNWKGTEISNITASNIDLLAEKGSIGQQSNYLNIESSNPVSGVVNGTAGNNIYLRETDGEINIGEFIAGNNIVLKSEGSILNNIDNNLPNFKANKIILISENGSIGKTGNRIKTQAVETTDTGAKNEIYLLEPGGDLNSNFMYTDASILDLLIPAGDMNVDEISTGELYLLLQAPGTLATIGQANIEDNANLKADNLTINNLLHTGSEPLALVVQGGSKKMADNVEIKGSSEVGMDFKELTANFAHIEAGADNVNFMKTRIGSRAELYNNYYSVIADNINKELFECDLQLYPRDKLFYLLFNADRLMLTDAMKVNYNPDFITNKFSTENSFVRETSKMPQVINNTDTDFTTILDRYNTLLALRNLVGRSGTILVNINGAVSGDSTDTESEENQGDQNE